MDYKLLIIQYLLKVILDLFLGENTTTIKLASLLLATIFKQ